MSPASSIDSTDIAHLRLNSQLLGNTHLKHIKDTLTWMVAIQAQDYPMAKWAIGARLPRSTEIDLENAINHAQVIRTHLLRPTWHFVAAEDVYWLLDLTAKRLKRTQAARDRQLGLTEEIYLKSNAIIENCLRDETCLTRADMITRLNHAKIDTKDNRASHLLSRAEYEKIICNGVIVNGKPSYTLLSRWVKNAKPLTKEEALFTLAKRYFTSRCPATVQDFGWWSGLNAADVRQALDLIKQDFFPEEIQGSTYWFPTDFSKSSHPTTIIHLLPTYDELLVSYADRKASIPPGLGQHMKKISDRGIFRPIIVRDGQVIGIWNQKIDNKRAEISVQLFSSPDHMTMDGISRAIEDYGSFLNRKLNFTVGEF